MSESKQVVAGEQEAIRLAAAEWSSRSGSGQLGKGSEDYGKLQYLSSASAVVRYACIHALGALPLSSAMSREPRYALAEIAPSRAALIFCTTKHTLFIYRARRSLARTNRGERARKRISLHLSPPSLASTTISAVARCHAGSPPLALPPPALAHLTPLLPRRERTHLSPPLPLPRRTQPSAPI